MLSLKNISSGNFIEGQLYLRKLPGCGIAANLKNSFIYNFILIIAFNYKMLMGYFTKKVEEVIFYVQRENPPFCQNNLSILSYSLFAVKVL